jgi:hypothetical protein
MVQCAQRHCCGSAGTRCLSIKCYTLARILRN